MRKYLTFLISAFLLILLLRPASAGEISADLAAKLAEVGASEKIPILIAVGKSSPSPTLKSQLAKEYRSRAGRHKAGIAKLKSEASVSQAGVLKLLTQMESSGLAENIKSHWIINIISAEIAASEIETVAALMGVEQVMQTPEIELIEPVQTGSILSSDAPASIQPNLITIGADSAWALGYDGEGRIVCSFDTGIELIHPALYEKWKGLDGDSAAAWFDPVDQLPYPHVFLRIGDAAVHGTQTMGLMVGQKPEADTTIGVAPGAKWISAAVINIFGASIIDAFEWAADPDGDPNTIDDVPDVINHSWGYLGSAVGCHDYFWEMIDNTEALGIVNIFAAGNEGDDPMTLRNPANRATDSLNCFGVGSVDSLGDSIGYFSSRGPSVCSPNMIEMIKPNVVAPGNAVWTSVGSVYYRVANGTSMAAPHVSGAVAILRQFAPDATVDEIKEALLAGCRRPLYSDPVPNNDYGWGLIYIPTSLEVLDSLTTPHEPDLRVYTFDYPEIHPGEIVSGPVAIKNFGGSLDSVYAIATGTNGGITVLVDSLHFGTIESDAIINSHIPFQAEIHDTVTAGRLFTVYFNMHGSGDYHCPCRLYIKVGESPAVGFYTHKNDILHFTISNLGQYGFAGGSFYPLGYSGFRYLDTMRNDLFEGALMIGVDSMHVSDGARNFFEEPDNDFAVSLGGDLVVTVPGAKADQETFSRFDDRRAESPIGLEIEQRTYFWENSPDNDFVILEYALKNISDTSIDIIYAGLLLDWDLDGQRSEDGGGFVLEENLGYVFYLKATPFSPPTRYRGVSVLNPEGLATHKLMQTPDEEPFYAVTESDKFLALADGSLDSLPSGSSSASQIVSTGPFSLLPGQSDTAVFAVVAANDSLSFLIDAAVRARSKYHAQTDVEIVETDIIPSDFTLGQNYPNPFNPVTKISFTLEARSSVTLSVYNLIGEKVTDLVDRNLSAGTYQVRWDGKDKNGREVATGIYFYRLNAGQASITRKMLLLK